MKILVFGTGAVGSIYAYVLEKGGAEVTAVCRSNFDAVSNNGISIESPIFGDVHARPKAVRTAADAQGPFDFVLVCSKAFPGTPALVRPAIGPETAIVLAQNGIGIEDEWVEAFPSNCVISGVVYLPTTEVSPGHIKMGPLQRLELGTYPSTASESAKSKLSRFIQVFCAGGGHFTIHDDIQARRWLKIAVNVAWNPLCALTRCDDANFFRSSPGAEDGVRKLMHEVARLTAAAGYHLYNEAIEEQLDRPRQRLETGGKEPSMLTDVRHGRALEVDAIVGNTIKIARRLQVDTPQLDLLYLLAKGLSYSIAPDGEWKPIA